MSETTSTAVYRFQLGQFACTAIQDQGWSRPIGPFFGDVPADEINAVAQQYQINPEALDFSMNILLVQTDSHLVMIDTGVGRASLTDKLRSAGIDPAAIDTIVITHGHGDHVGGIFDAEGNLQYPNAHFLMLKGEYDYWTSPEKLATADTTPAIGVMQKLHNMPGKLTLISGDSEETEIVPGVCTIFAPGHTPGHLAVLIESGTEKMLHIVDAAHVPIQITRPAWGIGADTDKTVSATTRSQLFARVQRDNLLMMTYHFTFPGLGRIVEGDNRWNPVKTG